MESALYVAPPEHLRDRLAARLRPRPLDAALANGTPAETNAALALRARRLTNLPRRRRLALTIRGLVREADGAEGAPRMRAGALWYRVSASRDELQLLADRLAEPAPVCPRGVAEVLLLVTDGTGPLYNPHSEADVCDRAESAIANLTPAA
jgi:hypothetical protein